MSLTSIKKYK